MPTVTSALDRRAERRRPRRALAARESEHTSATLFAGDDPPRRPVLARQKENQWHKR